MSKMNSKDKDNKTLHDKLKQFFRINKGKHLGILTSISRVTSGTLVIVSIGIAGSYKSREDFTLTHDIEKEISPDSPVHHRTKAIKELCDPVLNQQWEDVRVLIQEISFFSPFFFPASVEYYGLQEFYQCKILRFNYFE